MSVQTASTKPKERRLSVNVTMSVVHKTNRSEDKKLERRVEHLKQKEHQDQVRHCTEVKKLEKELESMQVQVEAAGRTFSKRETELQDVPYLFSKKMAAQQPRAVRQRRHRGDSAAAALNRVAKNVELSGKSRFRSAVMAVCVAKGLGEAASGEAVREQEDRETEEGAPGENTAIEGQNMNRSLSSARSGVKRDRLRRKTHPADRPNTSPGKTLTRRYSALRPPSTADQTGSQSQPRPGMNSARSVGRRNTTGNMSVRSAESPSPTPTVSLPDLVGAARASIVHAAESAKAASVLKRRGSAVSTVTAAERELERRRSSAALRLRDIKADLSKRNVDLQDRIKLFVRTSMPGECTVKSPRRLFAIPVGGEPATTSSEMDD